MDVEHEHTAEQRRKVGVLIGPGASYGGSDAKLEARRLGAELLTPDYERLSRQPG